MPAWQGLRSHLKVPIRFAIALPLGQASASFEDPISSEEVRDEASSVADVAETLGRSVDEIREAIRQIRLKKYPPVKSIEQDYRIDGRYVRFAIPLDP